MGTITLEVTYSRPCLIDYNLEARIKKLVKRDDTGSGYGFGGRDIAFDFKVEKAAKAAMARVRAAKIRGVKCKLYYDNKEEE